MNPSETAGAATRPPRGSLTVVGTGIVLATQITAEAVTAIAAADRVFFVLTSPAHEIWLRRLNPRAESLADCYAEGKPRQRTYREMADRIVAAVRAGQRVCAVFYGHPGVFTQPSHAAIKRLRREGFCARMLPGISAEDCLFADLGVNPGEDGCQSFEASNFLSARRRFDPASNLVLWQVGMLGEPSVRPKMASRPERVEVLTDRLLRDYPPRHKVALYEAAQYPTCEPRIIWVPLAKLPRQTITNIMTLFVPPLPVRRWDPRIASWFTL